MEPGTQAHRAARTSPSRTTVERRRRASPGRCGRSTSNGASPARCHAPGRPPSSSDCTPIADDDLLEWDYGDFEGLTTAEIRGTIAWLVGLDAPDHGRRDHRAGRCTRRPGDRSSPDLRRDDGARGSFPPVADPRRSLARVATGRGATVHPRQRDHLRARLGTREPRDHPVERPRRLGVSYQAISGSP